MNHANEECCKAILFDDEEDYAEYIVALTEKICANNSDYFSLNNRGVAYLEMGEYPNALQDFTEACQLAPREIVPFLNMVKVLIKMGDLKRALQFATEAIQIECQTGYYARADVYHAMGDGVCADEDTKMAKNCN